MKFTIAPDSTSRILQIPIYNSASTIGALLTGLVYNTASLTAYYNREGAAGAATAITLVTATKGTFTSSGFVAVDATNMPGWYELHVPNAAFAAGASSVAIHLKGAANMVPCTIMIELSVGGLDAGGVASAVWNAATATYGSAGTYGALVETNMDASISSRMATFTQPTGFLAATFPATVASTTNITAATGITVATNSDKTGYSLTVTPPTAIENADALLNRDMSTGTDSGSPTVRTVRQALRFLRNKWSITAGTLTVTKEDDTTASWTATVTTDATANPITGNDPA